MHVGPLGVQHHLQASVFFGYEAHLERWTDLAGKPIIGETGVMAVWQRLKDHLMLVGHHCPALTVSSFLSDIAFRICELNKDPSRSSCGIRATEQHLVMLVLPFCLPNLIAPEIARIKEYYTLHPEAQQAAIQRHDRAIQARIDALVQKHHDRERRQKRAAQGDDASSGLEEEDPDADEDTYCPTEEEIGKIQNLKGVTEPLDPSDEYIAVLYEWAAIYTELRRSETDDAMLADLSIRITRWCELTIRTFPYKSGQQAGFNFIKWHDLAHIVPTIPHVGWLENASTQAPEHCHQYFVKFMARMINRHPNWGQTVMDRLSLVTLSRMLSQGRQHKGIVPTAQVQ
jgi:hypothetical protein